MKILITGSAGFLGYHASKLFLDKKNLVLGIDNLNNYYDLSLKQKRLLVLKKYKNFKFKKIDISNFNSLKKVSIKFKPDLIINLAAQAGVRYSFKEPQQYIKSNIKGFLNILEICKILKIKNLVYASSSSVYGDNKNKPFKENDTTDSPKQIYAVTKKTNEYLAKVYSNIYKINCIGIRFFTVYGPYGRPDMAIYKFINKILSNKQIEVFNYGDHKRDFTYVDDAMHALYLIIKKMITTKTRVTNSVYNIASGKSEKISNMIKYIENSLQLKAIIKYSALQQGDMKETHASLKKISKFCGFSPRVSLKKGIKNFVKWYKNYYGL